MMQYQILQAIIIKIVRQIVRRITDEISGVKGLRQKLRNFRNSNMLRMRTAEDCCNQTTALMLLQRFGLHFQYLWSESMQRRRF